MPPVSFRKRFRSRSSSAEPSSKRPARRVRESIFQTLDAPPTVKRTLSQTKALLEQEEDYDSELSEPGSSEEEFEDVVIAPSKTKSKRKIEAIDSTDSEDNEEWEDALGSQPPREHDHEPMPVISGDLELTLSSTAPLKAFASNKHRKKGPTKIQRNIRNATHCMHVQSLMFHNLMRNAWVQDKKVQRILAENMTTGCWREMNRFWKDTGITDGLERVVQGTWRKRKPAEPGMNSGKNGRDWATASNRLEPNTPNLSAGDPLLRLLRYLSTFWKSKFKITTPSLRKRGYLSPSTLEAEIAAWKEDPRHAEIFGERIENLEAFREAARKCEGSKDVGQQLFTALLRGLGIEARMVASLQPVGLGCSQVEEGKPKNLDRLEAGRTTSRSTEIPKMRMEKLRRESFANGTKTSPISLDEDFSDESSSGSTSTYSKLDKNSKKNLAKAYKPFEELPNPTYWTEAISQLTHTPISVSPLPRPVIATPSRPDDMLQFYPRSSRARKLRQVFAYVIAFSSDGTAKDVTTRYLPKHEWPGKTKGFRMPVEKVPVYDKQGKIKEWKEFDWVKFVLRLYARDISQRQPWDEIEDEGDLVPPKPKDIDEEGGKETVQGYKESAGYVLERHLRREEALKPGAEIVRHFVTGKGENLKKEPVYRRKDITLCKPAEWWYKEGRAVKEGEHPLKLVPVRAVTATRKRELKEQEREGGEKAKQGLYSEDQTDWIIPDPIVDGVIPKNAFGNMDVYVPTMIPKGAVHIPLKGSARICRLLNIDYAEACTGFEYFEQRAVQVLKGVVVAAEHEDLVIEAWELEEEENQRIESEKMEKLLLGLWRRFYLGLKIKERLKVEYGDDLELLEQQADKEVHEDEEQ
ncbi:Rad4-domain-containing protein [Lojkania enalia]|uniref:Rad4-domain-containing protein n=1 Tax=Lojkania enalia TaxID=147567 RepID=A0A9P4N7J3_9PLEO|nr:Rad4-domain-containing protein [Didymosphaeria enalia]